MSGVNIKSYGQVLEIVLDRPKTNAIDSETSLELNKAFIEFNSDTHHRVAIITGAGNEYFCTGGDLKELDAKLGNVYYGEKGFAGLTHFVDMSKPVIAAVNGMCVGGGFELLLACDLVVSNKDSIYFLPETKIGNVPYLLTIQRILKRLPRNLAMEMLYTGCHVTAQELASHGFINSLVQEDQVMSTAYQLAEKIIRSAPLSVSACKEASLFIESMSSQELIKMEESKEFEFFNSVMVSEDAKEGARAFVEKRKPVWLGC